ncbi:MAG: membrane protein insertase YidC [Actinomycetaceae bacterium]|nr:membrane protein insertase YidC [Arcanobacterium sp.]MDD7687178.1 membrane protein insertase YidC [Actinomycetaceae bacterium]MDY5273074.1 membrane protein insertase YidC [Arcanobacterium sp.]
MDTILFPLMWVIGWIIVGVHKVLTFLGMAPGPGVAWVLAIVGMTVIVRALMIPLFNKQIRSQRAMQRLTPEIQKIQKKYKGKKDQISQQRQQEELMALYKSHGSSPFASCLPMLIQMPIFFALYRVLWNIGPLSEGTYTRSLGGIDKARAAELAGSTVFGAPLTSSIGSAAKYGDSSTRVIIVAVVLIALMIITLFITQKQVMTKNMPVSADPNNPAEKMTKYMLYGMPLIYIFTGYAFQVGVLVYWLASNIWNMGQQTWLITTNPSPGSPAYKARQEKLRAKRIAKGLPPEEDEGESDTPAHTGQRVQPMSAKRQKKKGKNYDPLAHGASDLSYKASEQAPNDGDTHGTTESEVADEEEKEPVGKDGLTDAQRAQKRYERRLAERQRSREKAQKRAQRQQQNKKQRNF